MCKVRGWVGEGRRGSGGVTDTGDHIVVVVAQRPGSHMLPTLQGLHQASTDCHESDHGSEEGRP